MAKQMDMFDDGGLMDEGGTVDPVSGNDVPPGSTQEEVRDDIPAQLSEGEFVFPADVVRYFGLEKLMEMRQEAKMGLQRMEDMGQMGNSEEAIMPDNLPFTLDDLEMEEDQSDLNFNLGGVVPMQGTGVVNTANAGPTTGFTPYVAPAIPGFTGPQLQNTQYTTATQTTNLPTFLQTVGTKPGEYDEFRRYVNDAGQVRQIPFKNGQPLYPIPEGYRFEAEDTTQVTAPTTRPVTIVGQNQDDGGGGDDNSGVTSGRVGTTLGTNPAIGLPNVLASGVASQADEDAFGGNVGAFNNAGYRSAVIDLGSYQLGSLSPTSALANQMGNMLSTTDIGKALGIEQSGNYNEIGTAMNQARNTALAELGLSNMSQVTTNAQYDAITASMVAAQTAAKKGDLNHVAATRNALVDHQAAIQAGRVSAMTDLGYSPSAITDRASVQAAIDTYGRNIGQLDDAIETTQERGAVTTVDPVTGLPDYSNPVKNKGKPVMRQRALDKINAYKQTRNFNLAKLNTLEIAKANADQEGLPEGIPSSPADFGALSPEDIAQAISDANNDGGMGFGSGGHENASDDAMGDDGIGGGASTGSSSSGGGHGMGDGTSGVGDDDGDEAYCLTEDMKVKLNGTIDFVTNIKIGDMIDNYKVKEVLYKHMRSGYYAINNELKISNDHPVLANGTWIRPEDLVVGDSINGIPVASLEYVERMTPTVSIVIDGESFDVHTENNIYTVHGRYKEVRQEAA